MCYVVSFLEGVKRNDRRQVIFLHCDGDDSINAKAAFSAFEDKHRFGVHSRFDHWIDGNTHDLYFHGWNEDDKKYCFCFKWHEGRSRCRLYGFLLHPGGDNNPRLEVCVISIFARKFTEETDQGIINQLNKLRTDPKVIKVVEDAISKSAKVKGQDDGTPKTIGKKANAKLGRRKR